jgi:hypothetical protein
VRQDQVATLLEHTFTVAEPSGPVLAHLKKNPLTALYRTKWVCHGPNGRCLAVAIEDSLARALVRRYVIRVTPMNFVFRRGETEQVIGRFDRKFTLLDRYVLDLSADPEGTLDRRIALAPGVVLDTGERRQAAGRHGVLPGSGPNGGMLGGTAHAHSGENAMAYGIRRVEYFHATVVDQPGEAYKVLSVLAGLGVNLLAFTAVPVGPDRTQITLFPEDPGKMKSEAQKARMVPDGPHRRSSWSRTPSPRPSARCR